MPQKKWRTFAWCDCRSWVTGVKLGSVVCHIACQMWIGNDGLFSSHSRVSLRGIRRTLLQFNCVRRHAVFFFLFFIKSGCCRNTPAVSLGGSIYELCCRTEVHFICSMHVTADILTNETGVSKAVCTPPPPHPVALRYALPQWNSWRRVVLPTVAICTESSLKIREVSLNVLLFSADVSNCSGENSSF